MLWSAHDDAVAPPPTTLPSAAAPHRLAICPHYIFHTGWVRRRQWRDVVNALRWLAELWWWVQWRTPLDAPWMLTVVGPGVIDE